MPDPTLADVLAALERDDDTYGPDAAPLALHWIDANRIALERLELEQAARKAVGSTDCALVAVIPNDHTGPVVDEFCTHLASGPLVIVGANWKPEVKL
jgi:hypothetical protein